MQSISNVAKCFPVYIRIKNQLDYDNHYIAYNYKLAIKVFYFEI